MLKRSESEIVVTEHPDFTAEKYGTGDGKNKADYVSLDDWLWIDRTTRSGSRQRLRVTVTEYRGKWGINIRLWYKRLENQDEWRPTWKGIWLTPDEARAIGKALLAGMDYCDEKEKAGESPF